MERRRDLRIDSARGIACILLVAFHVVGVSPIYGMRIPAGHWIGTTNEVLGMVRMPLFTIISGIVYAARPVTFDQSRAFMKGKALRLLLPLVFVGIPFAVMQKLTPGANIDRTWTDIALVPLVSFAHFWFLQALFLIFALVVVLEAGKCLSSLPRALAVLAVSFIVYAFNDRFTSVFSLTEAFYLLPYFLSGVLIARFSESIYRPSAVAGTIVAMAAVLCLVEWSAGVRGAEFVVEPVAGLAFAFALLYVIRPVYVLAFIGYYSYTIYLFHVFGTAATRMVLLKMNIDSWAILFAGCMAVGIVFPICVHRIASRIPYVSRAFLGIRAQKA